MREDITGKKFGYLTVIKQCGTNKKHSMWECRCDCGKVIQRRRDSFIKNPNASCGCKLGEIISKATKGKIRPNNYDLSNEYGKCFLGNTFFIFDLEDYEKIKEYRWFLSNGYVSSHNKEEGSIFRLHRFIMACPEGLVVDHINHNKLDNRKCNLRICSHAENNRNIRRRKNNKSGYPGVDLVKSKRWIARIGYNNEVIYLGTYDTKEEAINAKKEAEKKYFGKYAYKEG